LEFPCRPATGDGGLRPGDATPARVNAHETEPKNVVDGRYFTFVGPPLAKRKLDEIFIILPEQGYVNKADDVPDSGVFEAESLLEGDLSRPRELGSKLFVGVNLQRAEACADVAFGNGGESESLAKAAADERGFGDLVIRTQSEHRFSRACAIDGEVLVPGTACQFESFTERLIHLDVRRAVGCSIVAIR